MSINITCYVFIGLLRRCSTVVRAEHSVPRNYIHCTPPPPPSSPSSPSSPPPPIIDRRLCFLFQPFRSLTHFLARLCWLPTPRDAACVQHPTPYPRNNHFLHHLASTRFVRSRDSSLHSNNDHRIHIIAESVPNFISIRGSGRCCVPLRVPYPRPWSPYPSSPTTSPAPSYPRSL